MGREVALQVDCHYRRQWHVSQYLTGLGLRPIRVRSISAGEQVFRKHCCRVMLVDRATAGDGIFDFCSSVRDGSPDTIIMVLMNTIEPGTEERLFDRGVDDVLVARQPIARLLAKRVKARLRTSHATWRQSGCVRLNDTVVDFDRREVWCNGTVRKLPGILTDLLKHFVDNPDRVISRKELFESPIWAESICTPAEEGGKTFDVNVGKLRKIIECDPQNPRIIQSVRGVGWKLGRDVVV